jgi:glycosyltransferase involved in cell wall biosynthesis
VRIAFITAGAAGMFCGSCLRDNALVGALNRIGHDALLIPTYTPIRTDDEDLSQKRVFFGGINVYLQQKSRFFRHTPWLADRLLDFPRLLRWVSRFAARTPYSALGALTISMLKGDEGFQKKEVAKLVDYLRAEVKPEFVLLTNALLSGLLPTLRASLGVPIFVTLQGDDVFLDALPERDRQASVELIARNLRHAAGTIATCRDYADYMQAYLGLGSLPSRIIYPGISIKGHGDARPVRTEPPYTIGYFARIAPEKGFHALVDAFLRYRKRSDTPKAVLKASGWLGENHRPYFDEQLRKLADAGLTADFEYVESKDLSAKVRFLRSLDLLSVPATFREPKGLYVLEANANGVPVVQPASGSFPELIERTGGGVLVPPNDADALAGAFRDLLLDPTRRRELGERGHRAVRESCTSERMAEETVKLLAESRQTPA